ncbi:MAG: C40 family peptidase [Granulosicoccus sp.]|nr:C40 family peptidase [Granulosicoccus sp.]
MGNGEGLHRVCIGLTPVQSQPSSNSMCTNEALYGEMVQVLTSGNGWARVRQLHDGYEGYIDSDHLHRIGPTAGTTNTHWVGQRSTLLFDKPDIKSRVVHRIPFAAELALVEQVNDSFSLTACNHYVWTSHCLSLSVNYPAGPLELARTHFLGAPYRWGGRSPEGLDCSGLIQMLARTQGHSIPRDSGDQERALDLSVHISDCQVLDLMYWPGHAGILVSPESLLHATAHSLDCRIEPLREVIARAGPASSVKRLFSNSS